MDVVKARAEALSRLRQALQGVEAEAARLRRLVQHDERALHELCAEHGGHSMRVEVDDDCHSPSLISVCGRCGYWCFGATEWKKCVD